MQNQPSESKNIFQQAEMLRTFTVLPALTVMVFIRRRMGYRLLNPGWLLGMGFGVWLVACFSYDRRQVYPQALGYFAIASTLLGLLHRIRRQAEFRKGGSQSHSYSPGISMFQGPKSPRIFTVYRRINRLVDPLMVAMLGGFALEFSVPLGRWLIFSAFCLAVYEQSIQEKAIERDLDIADGLVVGEIQSETVKHFKAPANTGSNTSEGAIPTGLGNDIRRKPRKS